ncbi:SART-1 family protein DOT2 isoform X2 [Cucumis melo var. makuwa]|uniref:SART-1 family protein DOT2 isoform X2 n=1 Tax=Cucumis melo var. makuwa TaxID=1194695 RepID=A0A5D3BNU7_CUCMM|nr:SART-1 family protein DOT2 isoform X2 [Cucumis melo var. makuwa]TYK00432.1 SART-1 family protein DOT2 isoform X2 [Cucumis melo var. makuwa]
MDWERSSAPDERNGDDLGYSGAEKSSKHRSEDHRKSSRGEEKDHRSKDRERSKRSSDDASKEKEKEKGREKHRDQEEKESYRNVDKERGKERILEDDRKTDQTKQKLQDKEGIGSKNDEERTGWIADEGKDYMLESDGENNRDRDVNQGNMVQHLGGEENFDGLKVGSHPSSTMLEERIRNMKEDRLKKQTEESEVLAWVKRSRKLEEKKLSEKEKALQLSKIFEEQDNIDQDVSDDDIAPENTTNNHDLTGVKVLHGVDKVLEGGAVVLTLKDQSILADGDVNEELDMLENVEIGEQKQRDMAYKAAKKKTGIYDDKFNDENDGEKKMLPQYDDPAEADEGLTLDGRGGFNNDAEKKLEELRRRLQGTSSVKHFEDLNVSTKVSHDYYTQDEMLKFKKPRKKKSLRKKEKLDIDALEAEAISAGLGVGDLGSRNDSRRQAKKEEQEKSEAEMRLNAYQSAYAKADEASRSLQLVQTSSTRLEDNDDALIADDDEDFYKSLERARKLALKKQDAASGPGAIALLATATTSSQATDDQNTKAGELQENKVVFTEMEEFVWGLQLDEDAHKPEEEDVFMDDDEVPKEEYHEDVKDKDGGWTEVKDTAKEESIPDENEAVAPDETIHEVPVGKGLSSALKLLKDRGTLKESIEWGGRNMDKRKSKLVGIVDEDEPKESKSKDSRLSSLVDYKKEIHIERTDEFGRIMTPKESFRQLSHKFHGKGPGKMKQEKRMKQYQEELKLKQMKNADTPSLSVERMREAQAQLKTPYLVLSGHVKPGQTSDPRSGFATVEKDLPGGLTPMLGDRKVEHFLGIKRKGEASNTGTKKAKV